MNFLQLTQKLCRKIGYDLPSTVEGMLDNDTELVKEWISDAWVEIQYMCQRFAFMLEHNDVNILQDKKSYTAAEVGITNIQEWVLDEMYLFDGSDYVRKLVPKPEATMREMQYIDPKSGEPEFFSEGFDGSVLELYPTPEQAYTLKTVCKTVPVVLSLDTDIPACPIHFHKIIYYYALKEYAVSDASPEDHQHGESRFELLLNRMDLEQCPQVSIEATGTRKSQDATYYV